MVEDQTESGELGHSELKHVCCVTSHKQQKKRISQMSENYCQSFAYLLC